jgi:hypothetical protein
MDAHTETLITTTIGNFCRLTDIGRSKTYELLASGALDSLKIGKRRLIILDSYRKLIEQQRANGSSAQSWSDKNPPLQPGAAPPKPSPSAANDAKPS